MKTESQVIKREFIDWNGQPIIRSYLMNGQYRRVNISKEDQLHIINLSHEHNIEMQNLLDSILKDYQK